MAHSFLWNLGMMGLGWGVLGSTAHITGTILTPPQQMVCGLMAMGLAAGMSALLWLVGTCRAGVTPCVDEEA
jgi:hypothetical protein